MTIYYGVSYYPEFRNIEEQSKDLQLLEESGVNVVRMADFAWSMLEPDEGDYRFEWLEQVVNEAGKRGIASVLCTPTAAPPAWLVERHPDLLYRDNYDRLRPFGGRRHYCYNHEGYREYSRTIASRMAEHFRGNEFVVGWQIDNELAQEGTGRCRCEGCRLKFHEWLKNRYGTIDCLNEAWGTVFWSQRYNHFGQIGLPVANIEPNTSKPIESYFDNPSLRLDFERFCSECQIDYQNVQTAAIRQWDSRPVTTNSTGLATNSINLYEGSRELDRFALDIYPDMRGNHLYGASFVYAFSRGVKPEHRFWVLELACGGGHALWGLEGRLQPYPGALAQLAVQAFALGAELVAHYQFLSFPYGAEQLNYAIVDADGVPRRRYYEMQRAAGDIRKMAAALEQSRLVHEVAICFDYDSLWALRIKPIHRNFDYVSFLAEWYAHLAELGCGADVIPLDKRIHQYKVVILPAAFVLSDDMRIELDAFVRNGGTLISTFVTSVKTTANTGEKRTLPAGLTDLFGVTVEEVEPVFQESIADIGVSAHNGTFHQSANRYWTEVLVSAGAEMIGTYLSTFRKEQGVISKHKYGDGHAYYFGTVAEPEVQRYLLDDILTICDVKRVPFKLPHGVEVIQRRRSDGSSLLCLFNTTPEAQEIALDRAYVDLLSGDIVKGTLLMPLKSYHILF